MGSTFAAQKVIIINCIRMSVGQAKQYIKAREKLVGNFINEVSQ
jgi:hypothetical protein